MFFLTCITCLVLSSSDLKTTAYDSHNVPSTSPNPQSKSERRHIPSASTALIIGTVLGILQTIFLIFLAKPLLGFMGVKSVSVLIINSCEFFPFCCLCRLLYIRPFYSFPPFLGITNIYWYNCTLFSIRTYGITY